MGAERLQGNRGKSPAETRFLCLPVSPAPGGEVTQRLHRPCEPNAAPLAAPYDIFPLRKIKEEQDPPGGRAEIGGWTRRQSEEGR